VTGGRIETHFHVFGSLAFLACYRDWKVLIPATLIVAVDHFVRGVWWPESVFGVVSASHFRWLEHAGWVLFEDVFLTIACLQGEAEMRSIAARTAALEDTDRWKTSIFEAALEAVVGMDCEGRITEWNSKAESLFGWIAAEVIGKPLHEIIFPEEYREQHCQGLRAYREMGFGSTLNRRIEISAIRRDGLEFPVELAITPILSHQQLTFCAFIRDITARRQGELDLRRAKEAAEEANHAKSRFLANMSHEIRTPLNGILGFTELLRRKADRGDDDKRREFVETIERSGRHLLTVINDVLDLSKIEAGQITVDRVRCSPHEMIAEVVSILRVNAQEKGLSLNYSWDGDVPESIDSDPDRLRQILMNVVGNAIKFTEQGSVTIQVNLERDSDRERTLLKFKVKDSGVGISNDKLEVIFKPFVQADSSVTRLFGGTGLGLSISKRLCELLGGSIGVQSQPGLGSLFTFSIDAGRPQFGKSKIPITGDVIPSAPKCTTDEALHGKHILLVEDGQINRQLIEIVLRDAGMQVTLTENGKQGLEAALEQVFDAVLLDMQMPVMDGYTAATEMRAAGVRYPIIALTAHAMSGDAEKCFQVGCSHYLSKPIEAERLLCTLASVMAYNSAGGSPSAFEWSTRSASQVDVESLRSKLPIDRPLYRDIVRDYVNSLAGILESIETACREEDLLRLHELCHALKGSGGTAGIPALTVAAERLVQIAEGRDATKLPQQVHHLRDIVQRVIAVHAGV
jgi:PAS domain S-box-containing protein